MKDVNVNIPLNRKCPCIAGLTFKKWAANQNKSNQNKKSGEHMGAGHAGHGGRQSRFEVCGLVREASTLKYNYTTKVKSSTGYITDDVGRATCEVG